MKILKSLKVGWEVYHHLYKKYLAGNSKEQKSLFNDKITSVREQSKNLVKLLKSCIALNPPKKAAFIILSETFLKRGTIVKDILIKCGQLKTLITDGFVIKSLKLHVSQQNHILTSEFKIDKEQNLGFVCFNDTSILSTKVSELLIKEETSPDKGGFSLSILQEAVKVIFSYLIFINKTLSSYFCKLGTKRDPFSLTFLNLFTHLGHLN